MFNAQRSLYSRSWLITFAATFLVLAAVGVGQAQNGSTSGPGVGDVIVGTWECDGTPGPFKVTKNFEAGGTMMEVDNITPFESPTVGSWKRTENLEYFLAARQYTYDTSGQWLGTFQYTQPLTMDSSRQTMQGTFHCKFVDPNGNVSDCGDGAVSCRRMPLE